MQVLKFGGSSVADATRMSRVLDIVLAAAEKDRVILVSSAVSGCTDALIALGEERDPAAKAQRIGVLRDRHRAIARRLFTGAERREMLAELDGLFDRVLFHGAWGLVDAFVLAAMAAVLVRAFDRTVAELAEFAATPQCLLLVAGLVFAVVVAQLIGYKEVWNRIFDVEIWTDAAAPHLREDGHLPGDIDVVRHVKNTVEESFELGSYLLILASAALPPLLRRGAKDRD